MSDTPLVSLIMISYNSVQYIKAAIDSVQAQTYKNWELVINDDVSTDGTWELAQKLAEQDKRIIVRQNKTNLGIPKNRAKAFQYTNGELIGHFDNDDLLYPYSVETMVEFLNKNPDVALAYSDHAWAGVDGDVSEYHKNEIPSENLANHGWRHFGMYRRTAYDTVDGYNTKIKNGCEDGDLFMQIAEKYKFARVPHVLYRHRWHGGNASHRNQPCEQCNERPVCNYIRVWAKHAGVDPLTMQPINTEPMTYMDAGST